MPGHGLIPQDVQSSKKFPRVNFASKLETASKLTLVAPVLMITYKHVTSSIVFNPSHDIRFKSGFWPIFVRPVVIY